MQRCDFVKALGHMIFGFCLGAIVTAGNPLYTIIVVAASPLPDIDHPYSTYGKYFPAACLMKHRGHCHSIIGSVLIALPFLYLSINVFALVLIACLGHLVADRISSSFTGKWKFQIKVW